MNAVVPESMSEKSLEAFLHEKIPLTRAMGLHVAESNARRLVLEAPLDKNVNHLGTAFGGSLHTLPTLACYAGLWTLLREAGIDGHVVVKHSAADYLSPVKGTLRAVCVRPPAAEAEPVDPDELLPGTAVAFGLTLPASTIDRLSKRFEQQQVLPNHSPSKPNQSFPLTSLRSVFHGCWEDWPHFMAHRRSARSYRRLPTLPSPMCLAHNSHCMSRARKFAPIGP
mgnify:CR=1 FL=1